MEHTKTHTDTPDNLLVLVSWSYLTGHQKKSVETRTSRSKATGCCWSRCRPHSSTSQWKGRAPTASAGPWRRPGRWGCRSRSQQLSTAASHCIGTWGLGWAVASGASSAGERSPGRVWRRFGRKTSSPLFFQSLFHCQLAGQPSLRRWRDMFLHPLFSSSSSPCWRSGRGRNECRAASLSQTKKKRYKLVFYTTAHSLLPEQ